MDPRFTPSILLLAALGACGGGKKRAPATSPPADAALDARTPWTEVREGAFVVEMPAAATREDDGAHVLHLPDNVSYRLNVQPVPAFMIASGPDAIIAQVSKTARKAGKVTREQRLAVGELHGLELDAVADGVNVFLAYLPAGRWHAQLTAIYPTGHLDAAAARRFLESLRVDGLGTPAAGSWECDALLAKICDECGDKSPACTGAIVGQTRDSCAVEATMRRTFTADVRDKGCRRIAKARKLDLSAMKDVTFDPAQVQLP